MATFGESTTVQGYFGKLTGLTFSYCPKVVKGEDGSIHNEKDKDGNIVYRKDKDDNYIIKLSDRVGKKSVYVAKDVAKDLAFKLSEDKRSIKATGCLRMPTQIVSITGDNGRVVDTLCYLGSTASCSANDIFGA